ncbi:Ulp1 family isopeptidase [endosymbiont GvMRE of Glomus versiforme]|uniref:Ulp1 family isopeptidase n=1 Tax=endosymbiont GvMRE of Glomus versiforme TaxID=2039283 RepID=UPI000EC771D9|nr:Ulp1 family isopeptidase [endosymbiont GvMRE of Glomus versiforme]RHZ36906.1 Sentrin/sumo protease 8 [endosymbiont GvMRE of Glomus versiforme]
MVQENKNENQDQKNNNAILKKALNDWAANIHQLEEEKNLLEQRIETAKSTLLATPSDSSIQEEEVNQENSPPEGTSDWAKESKKIQEASEKSLNNLRKTKTSERLAKSLTSLENAIEKNKNDWQNARNELGEEFPDLSLNLEDFIFDSDNSDENSNELSTDDQFEEGDEELANDPSVKNLKELLKEATENIENDKEKANAISEGNKTPEQRYITSLEDDIKKSQVDAEYILEGLEAAQEEQNMNDIMESQKIDLGGLHDDANEQVYNWAKKEAKYLEEIRELEEKAATSSRNFKQLQKDLERKEHELNRKKSTTRSLEFDKRDQIKKEEEQLRKDKEQLKRYEKETKEPYEEDIKRQIRRKNKKAKNAKKMKNVFAEKQQILKEDLNKVEELKNVAAERSRRIENLQREVKDYKSASLTSTTKKEKEKEELEEKFKKQMQNLLELAIQDQEGLFKIAVQQLEETNRKHTQLIKEIEDKKEEQRKKYEAKINKLNAEKNQSQELLAKIRKEYEDSQKELLEEQRKIQEVRNSGKELEIKELEIKELERRLRAKDLEIQSLNLRLRKGQGHSRNSSYSSSYYFDSPRSGTPDTELSEPYLDEVQGDETCNIPKHAKLEEEIKRLENELEKARTENNNQLNKYLNTLQGDCQYYLGMGTITGGWYHYWQETENTLNEFNQNQVKIGLKKISDKLNSEATEWDGEEKKRRLGNLQEQLKKLFDKEEFEAEEENQQLEPKNTDNQKKLTEKEQEEVNNIAKGLDEAYKKIVKEKTNDKNNQFKGKQKDLGTYRQQKKNEGEMKDWFTPRRWIIDREIDWAMGKVVNEIDYRKVAKYKILDNIDFMFVKEVDRNDFEGSMAFPTLLSNLTNKTSDGELVFIPVNNPNFHWSLLAYEKDTKTFHHWDTLENAPNHGYAKPVVKELLQHLHNSNSPDLINTHFKLKNKVRQPNTYDCGVAVIAFMEKMIKENGLDTDLSDLNNNFGPERKKWRTRVEAELAKKEDNNLNSSPEETIATTSSENPSITSAPKDENSETEKDLENTNELSTAETQKNTTNEEQPNEKIKQLEKKLLEYEVKIKNDAGLLENAGERIEELENELENETNNWQTDYNNLEEEKTEVENENQELNQQLDQQNQEILIYHKAANLREKNIKNLEELLEDYETNEEFFDASEEEQEIFYDAETGEENTEDTQLEVIDNTQQNQMSYWEKIKNQAQQVGKMLNETSRQVKSYLVNTDGKTLKALGFLALSGGSAYAGYQAYPYLNSVNLPSNQVNFNENLVNNFTNPFNNPNNSTPPYYFNISFELPINSTHNTTQTFYFDFANKTIKENSTYYLNLGKLTHENLVPETITHTSTVTPAPVHNTVSQTLEAENSNTNKINELENILKTEQKTNRDYKILNWIRTAGEIGAAWYLIKLGDKKEKLGKIDTIDEIEEQLRNEQQNHHQTRTERDNYRGQAEQAKTQLNNHICPVSVCLHHDYQEIKQKNQELKIIVSSLEKDIHNKETQIIQKLITDLELINLDENANVEQVIETIRELINKPPTTNIEYKGNWENELEIANQTITKLEKELKEEQTPFGEDLQVIKNLELTSLTELFGQVNNYYQEQIQQAANYQQVVNARQAFIQEKLSQKQNTLSVVNQPKQELIPSPKNEDIILKVALIGSLITIGGLIVRMQNVKRNKQIKN